MQDGTQLYDVWMANRPARAVYIVPGDVDWEQLSDVIEHSCSWWGGSNSLILPLSESDSLVSDFIPLLRLFDPDIVFAFEIGISETLKTHLLRHCSPLMGGNGILCTFAGQTGGNWPVTPIWSIPFVLKHLPPTVLMAGVAPGPHRLLLDHTLGRWDEGTIEALRANTGGDLEPVYWERQTANEQEALREANRYRQDTDLLPCPAEICDAELIPILRKSESRGIYAPSMVVVGDTPIDFCMFHSLRRCFGQHVFWFPWDPTRIASTAKHDILRSSIEIHEALRNLANHGYMSVLRTSSEALQCVCVGQHAQRRTKISASMDRLLGLDWSLAGRVRAKPADDTSTLGAGSVYRYYERESHREMNLPFIEGDAAGFLPLQPSGQAVGDDPAKVNWLFDFCIDGYIPPSDQSVVSRHFAKGVSSESSARVGRSNHLAVLATSEFIQGGLRVSEVMRPVQLRMPPAARLLAEIMRGKGYTMVRDANAQYADALIDRFGGLPGAVQAISDPYIRAVFELASDASRNESGVHDRGALLNDRAPRILDVRALERLSRETDTDPRRAADVLNLLVMKHVLLRGLPLKCATCSNSDWYELTDLGRNTICTRCRSLLWPLEWDAFAPTPASKTDWPDPHFHYRLNEMLFQLWDNDVWAGLLGAHLYTHDVKHPLFLLEQKVGKEEGGAATQVDWICVDRGDILIGEAKTADTLESNKDRKQIDDYCRLAIDIGAHVSYLTTCSEWSDNAFTRLEEARNRLAEHELRLDTLTASDVLNEQPLDAQA